MQFFRSVVPTCCIRIHADALINTSAGLIHREEGDIYQGINRENQTKAAEGNKNKTNFCEKDPTHCFSWTAEWPSNQMCHFWEVTKADVVHSKLEPQQGIQHANVKEHGMWTGDCNTASAPKCRNHTNMKRTFPDDKICFVKFRTSGQTGQQACQLQLVPQRLSHFTLSLYRVHITTRQTYTVTVCIAPMSLWICTSGWTVDLKQCYKSSFRFGLILTCLTS